VTADDAALTSLEAELDAVPSCTAGQYDLGEIRHLLTGALLLGHVESVVSFVTDVVAFTAASGGDVSAVAVVLAALLDVSAALAGELPPDRRALVLGALSSTETTP